MRARRNLHTSITPETLRLLRATAAYLGRTIGEVLEDAIRAYCPRRLDPAKGE